MITHSTEKKFLCTDCGFSTSHASVFKSHQRIHTGKTLKCGLPGCTFETIRKHNLVQHQLTHSKEKPHQCEVCGKSFSLVKNMRRHKAQHDLNALKHRCHVDGCDFASLRSDKFVEHMKKVHEKQLVEPKIEPEVSSKPVASERETQPVVLNRFETVNPPNRDVGVSTPSFILMPAPSVDPGVSVRTAAPVISVPNPVEVVEPLSLNLNLPQEVATVNPADNLAGVVLLPDVNFHTESLESGLLNAISLSSVTNARPT